MKLKLRTFWILLLVLSSLWVAAVFGPLVYSLLSPTADLGAIVHSLQGRGSPPPQATAVVQQAVEGGGVLGRAIQVDHYAGSRTETQVYGGTARMIFQVAREVVEQGFS